MNFDQLKQFVCIVENKTYLEAAEICHVCQSSLSKSIIRLEKELDTKLFDRSKRNVSLTKQGQIFYNDTKNILEQYQEMLSHLQINKKERLVLATLPIINQYDLNPLIKRLQDDYQVVINETEEYQIQDIINHKNCDLAIIRENSIDYHNYLSYQLAKDELVVVMSKDHSLSKLKRINFDTLKEEQFLCMPSHTYVQQLFLQLCQQHHFEPEIIINARVESLISALQENSGISLLMKQSLSVFKHPNLVYRSLTVPVYSNIVLLYKKSRTDCLKKINY